MAGISRVVVDDVKKNIAHLSKRVTHIERAAVGVINADALLREQYDILLSAPGIGRRSAILLLSELAVLDATMTASARCVRRSGSAGDPTTGAHVLSSAV